MSEDRLKEALRFNRFSVTIEPEIFATTIPAQYLSIQMDLDMPTHRSLHIKKVLPISDFESHFDIVFATARLEILEEIKKLKNTRTGGNDEGDL